VPLYEYECRKCKHRFEKIESVSASATKKCPKCGGKATRLPSAPAIQFKGSGWYVTDYASKGSSATSGEKSEEKASASDKSEKSEKSEKSDKKPAATKEAPKKATKE
jgi:putative FmdB family regulatory protein